MNVGEAFVKGKFPEDKACLNCPKVQFLTGVVNAYHYETIRALKLADKAIVKRRKLHARLKNGKNRKAKNT